jgi:hypothetical protein
MPKFSAGCHYNEEETSRHLKNNIGYWPVQMNGNKFATGWILGKPVEVVMKGQILAQKLSSKSLPNQWSGRFLGTIGWDPSVRKSNRLHVDILRFSFIKLGYIL